MSSLTAASLKAGLRDIFPRFARTLAVITAAATLVATAGCVAVPAVVAPAHCLPKGPVTAASYQAMFDGWHDAAFSGADQVSAAVLPGGRSVWLFGDTLHGSLAKLGRQHADRLSGGTHNSIMIWTGSCARIIGSGKYPAALPDEKDGSYYWASSAAVDRGKLLVFAQRTRTTTGGAMGFAPVGSALFAFALNGGSDPVLVGKQSLPGGSNYSFGGAGIASDAGYWYLYSTNGPGVKGVYGSDVRLARAPKGSLDAVSSWQYWDGTGWVASWQAATTPQAAILPAPAGVGTALTVNRAADGSFVMLSKMNNIVGDYVASWTAPAPQGPWTLSNPQLAYAPGGTPTKGSMTYGALAHPEARLASGQLLISVCRGSFSLSDSLTRGNLYMPQFYEVTLPSGQLLPAT